MKKFISFVLAVLCVGMCLSAYATDVVVAEVTIEPEATEAQAEATPVATVEAEPTAAPTPIPTKVPTKFGTAVIRCMDGDGLVDVRKLPEESADLVGRYYNGVQVDVNSEPDKDWVAVIIDDQIGYVKAQYLAMGEQAGMTDATYAYVNTGSLNMRKRPNKRHEYIAKLTNGAVLTVLGVTDEWSHVCMGGRYGYIMSEFLTIADMKPTSQTELKIQNAKHGSYDAQASIKATADKTYDVSIVLTPSGDKDVPSAYLAYALYLNGEKVDEVPQEADAKLTYTKTITFDGEIKHAMLIPIVDSDMDMTVLALLLK